MAVNMSDLVTSSETKKSSSSAFINKAFLEINGIRIPLTVSIDSRYMPLEVAEALESKFSDFTVEIDDSEVELRANNGSRQSEISTQLQDLLK